MALVIVAVKLYHPFDTLDRYAASLTRLGIFQIDWEAWCSHHQQYAKRETSDGKLGRGNEMKIKEQDVFRMSEAQLDEYLDWYEKTWVNEAARRPRKGDLPQELLDMFSTSRLDGSVAPAVDITETIAADQVALDAKLAAVQASLRTRGVIREEEEADRGEPVRRIGSFYKRYRKEGDLPPHARTFFEAAASLIGAELSTMVLAVLQTEQLLLNYRNGEVRGRREEEGEEHGMEVVEEFGDGGEGFMGEAEDIESAKDSLDSDGGSSDDS
jgi:RNA polymerase I-specific transcription initiation factor RRN7